MNSTIETTTQQQVVRINGWGILHPDGSLELDYYHTELSYNKYGGPKLTPEQWMERYRPDCTLHRVNIELFSKQNPTGIEAEVCADIADDMPKTNQQSASAANARRIRAVKRKGGCLQGMVVRLLEMATRVVSDASARHQQISKGKLVYGYCYAVHHDHIYDLEDALKQLKSEVAQRQAHSRCGRPKTMKTRKTSTPDSLGEATGSAKLAAAENMDWQQVVLNGGPPCFHLEDESFCGRAERWEGHKVMYPGDAVTHEFVSLADLLRGISPNDPSSPATTERGNK